MESFNLLSRKDKYTWDVCQSCLSLLFSTDQCINADVWPRECDYPNKKQMPLWLTLLYIYSQGTNQKFHSSKSATLSKRSPSAGLSHKRWCSHRNIHRVATRQVSRAPPLIFPFCVLKKLRASLVAAIERAVDEVSAFDGGTSILAIGAPPYSGSHKRLDDHFVIALTDANFGQYNITAEDLGRAMNRHPKVKTALICICEDSEASW